MYRMVSGEAETEPVVGIACSGGGVRSAAFSFGALQALQEKAGLVHGPAAARFLSAVSGGSYAAAAVLGSLGGVLGTRPDDTDSWRSVPSADPLRQGSVESDYLRNHARYLLERAPFLTVLQFLGLVLGSLVATLTAAAAAGAALRFVVVAVGGSRQAQVWTLGLLVVALVFAAALSTNLRRARTRRAEYAGDLEITLYDFIVVVASLAAATGAAIAWTANAEAVADWFGASRDSVVALGLAFGVGGSAAVGPALVALVRAQLAPKADQQSRRSRLASLARSLAIALAELALLVLVPVALFAAFLIGWSGVATSWTDSRQLPVLLVAAVVLAAFGVLAAVWGDQALSPHAIYRNRLARAFSFVRQQHPAQPPGIDAALQGEESRWPVRARDRLDQPQLSALGPRLSGHDDVVHELPELLICASVNITEPGVAAAGSLVRPIVFSPTDIRLAGAPTGIVGTADFEKTVGPPRQRFAHSFDATLMSYVALTGAAVAPSMGKYTKSWLRAVLTLLNIRLGTWIPNPGSEQVRRWIDEARHRPGLNRCPSPLLWLRELRGRHYLRSRHIYVSDGGHYENLGIVELIRRGCDEVWAIDASDDDRGTWRALSESLNLIASELGCVVTGDFAPFALAEGAGSQLVNATSTDVTITGLRDGTPWTAVIHVVKLGMSAETNPVIRQLAGKYRKFPYDSTLNQLYTAERFDLYRALGYDSAVRAVDRVRSAAVTAPLVE